MGWIDGAPNNSQPDLLMKPTQIASGRLKMSPETDVPISRITPAEAVVLENIHRRGAGGQAVYDLVGVAIVDIADSDEKLRLALKYKGDIVEKLFPGNNPRLPASFEEAGFQCAEPVQAAPQRAPEPVPVPVPYDPVEDGGEAASEPEPEPEPEAKTRRRSSKLP
jgi:hypothetical protein